MYEYILTYIYMHYIYVHLYLFAGGHSSGIGTVI